MSPNQSPSTGRPFSLGLYLIIVFGVSWPFQAAMMMVARNWREAMTLSCVSMIMVSVGTYIAGRFVFRDGFSDAGWSWGRPVHWIVTALLPVFLWFVPAMVDLQRGSIEIPEWLDTERVSRIAVPMLAALLVAGFGEEFGWRGYMLPRIARTHTPRRAVLLHGFIWFCWHLPLVGFTLVLAGADISEATGIPTTRTIPLVLMLGALGGTLHGVFIGYLWMRSGSLAVVTVYHALYDLLRDAIAVTIELGPIATWWSSIVLPLLGLLLLIAADWRPLGGYALSVESHPDGSEEDAPPTLEF